MKAKHFLLLILAAAAMAAFLLAPRPAMADQCTGASNDNNVWWGGLGHDSFDSTYRSTFGAVTTSQGNVHIRFRTCQGDVTGVRLRVWNDRDNTESWYNLSWEYNDNSDPAIGPADFWGVDLPIPTTPTILYYFFEVTDGSDTDYYVDDDVKFYGGGWGEAVDNWDDTRSYQVTVYDPNFTTPSWMKNAVVYQIFPDRFRNGDTYNDPTTGGDWIYGDHAIEHASWTDPPCDPRASDGGDGTGPCEQDLWSVDFFGGDLAGITEKINSGYFTDLGVTALYLNPIFRSPSNHLYDTQDYLSIDPYFGDLPDFQNLISAANTKGIKVILDGVFNHTSSDSPYFDRYSRWDSSGNLTSPSGPDGDDDSGACESGSSAYYDWYFFPDQGNPGKDDGTVVYCANGAGDANQTYEAWYGYSSLPKLNNANSGVRNLIYSNGTSSVGPYWISQGASGWRLDVAGDIDPNPTSDPSNDFWEGFRSAVKGQNSNAVILGEEWGDASGWLLGGEWDSAMNYRLRSAILSWLADKSFSDNDSNSSSASGPISPISITQFDNRIRSIQEDYPPPAWYAMMNLLGSHDTNRILFLLKKSSDPESADMAKAKLKLATIFLFTYPGAPTIYYGDEVGLAPDGVWDGTTWQDDPYNRATYPWSDKGGSPDTDLYNHYKKLAAIRNSHAAYRTGGFETLLVDDTNHTYAYVRTVSGGAGLVILNRDTSAHTVTVDVHEYFNDGAVLADLLNGASYTVAGGNVSVPVNALWGAVFQPADPNAVVMSDLAARASLPPWSAVVATAVSAVGLFLVSLGVKSRANPRS